MRSRERSELCCLVSDAHYSHSLMAAADGHLYRALYHARLCVKNCQRAWAILERSQDQKGKTMLQDMNDGTTDSMIVSMSEMSLSGNQPVKQIAPEPPNLPGPIFWSLISRLFRGLKHLSCLFASHGLFSEVRHYIEQSQAIAKSAEATAFEHQSSALLGQYTIASGEIEQGMVLIKHAENGFSKSPRDQHYASLQLFLAFHHIKYGQLQIGESACVAAGQTLQHLMAKGFLEIVAHQNPTAEQLDVKLSLLTLNGTKVPQHTQTRQRRQISKRMPARSPDPTAASKPATEELLASEVVGLRRLKGEALRGHGYSAICKGHLDVAVSLLAESASYSSHNSQDVVAQALLTSVLHLRRGLEQLTGDPVFCVIPESAISCPSVSGRGHTTSKKSTNKTSARSLQTANIQPDPFHIAQNELMNNFKLARDVSSTYTMHQITEVLLRTLVLMSAVSSSNPQIPVSPSFLVYIMGMLRQINAI